MLRTGTGSGTLRRKTPDEPEGTVAPVMVDAEVLASEARTASGIFFC